MAEGYSYLKRKQINRNYHKFDREPERISSNSVYFPVTFYGHNQMHNFGENLHRRFLTKQRSGTAYNEYMIEIDAEKSKEPHFHIWRANLASKISNSRSKGISLLSTEGNVIYTQENKGGSELTEEQKSEFLPFLDENRFVLFLIYEGMQKGKIKSIENLDEETIKNLFTKQEMDKLIQKFNLKYNEINNQSARE